MVTPGLICSILTLAALTFGFALRAIPIIKISPSTAIAAASRNSFVVVSRTVTSRVNSVPVYAVRSVRFGGLRYGQIVSFAT